MTALWARLEPLLGQVQKSARHIDCEDGAVTVHHGPGKVSWLAHPDTDEVGLPDQGVQNVLEMIDLAGVPVRAVDRRPEHRLAVVGGYSAFDPEPLADSKVAEGILSRVGRRIGRVIERVWRGGGTFQEWGEHFDLRRWTDALEAEGLSLDWSVRRERDRDEVLPWAHLTAGLHEDFLWDDWEAATGGRWGGRLPLDAVLRLRRVHRFRHRARRGVEPRAGRRQPGDGSGPRQRRHHPGLFAGAAPVMVRIRDAKCTKVRREPGRSPADGPGSAVLVAEAATIGRGRRPAELAAVAFPHAPDAEVRTVRAPRTHQWIEHDGDRREVLALPVVVPAPLVGA